MTEDLNIDRMRKRLMLKALNLFPTIEQAANALGITDRTLYNLIEGYDIIKVNKQLWIEKPRVRPSQMAINQNFKY